MKKLFLAIIGLCLCTALYADMNPYIIGSGTVSAGGGGISDNFGSDTSADYTAINGGITISGGSAHGSTTWQKNMVYHETSLSSANQIVQADISYNGAFDGGEVLARVNPGSPTTGYIIFFENGSIRLYRFSNTTYTYIGTYDGSYGSGTYTVKLDISGSTIKVSVDGTERINTTDSTYSDGNYCGVGMKRDVANADVTCDNFTGEAQ